MQGLVFRAPRTSQPCSAGLLRRLEIVAAPAARAQITRQLLSYAWRLIFGILAPSEHFSVAETTAVSYIICYSHTTSRPGPSDTIQAQPAAHSDRSKRPAAAEKRPHF